MIKAYIYLERVQIPFSKFSHRKLKTRNWEWILEEHNTQKKTKKTFFFSKTKKLYPTSMSSQQKLKTSIKPPIQT